jgi:hypothetical protein
MGKGCFMSGVKKITIREEVKALQAKINDLKNQIISKVFFADKKEERLTVQIGDKGTVNIYGLGRYPVCLYMSQAVRLEKLLTNPEFKQFIIDNNASLAKKEDKKAE